MPLHNLPKATARKPVASAPARSGLQTVLGDMKAAGQTPWTIDRVQSFKNQFSALPAADQQSPDARLQMRTLGIIEQQMPQAAGGPQLTALPSTHPAGAPSRAYQPYTPPASSMPGVQTLPGGPRISPQGPVFQNMNPLAVPQPPGPGIVPLNQPTPADNAINEVAGIAQRLRGLPTMQSERIAAEANARQNLLNTRDQINSGLQQRNAGALAGRVDPLAAAQPQAQAPVPTPKLLGEPFATPRYGQTAEQAGSAYDAARSEGARRLNGASLRILADRGDTMGKAQVARVGQNSTLLRTPDGRVNVVGNRNREIFADASQTGEFPQAMADNIRAQAKPNGSIVSAGRSQEQKDTRALRAQRLYGLPSSTPAVAQAAARAKVGGSPTSLAGLPPAPQTVAEAASQLQRAQADPVFQQFGVNPATATPSQWTSMILNNGVAGLGPADHAKIRAGLQAAMAPGMNFHPDVDQKAIIDAYMKGNSVAAKKRKTEIDAENKRLIGESAAIKPSHKF